jgi:hypothetical protein
LTLVKVIDPAQGTDEHRIPDGGKRFVGAVFRISALSGSLQDENANNAAAAIGTNGQVYPQDIVHISAYNNFGNGSIHVARFKAVTGSVSFPVPDGVKVAKVQWTSASGVRFHRPVGCSPLAAARMHIAASGVFSAIARRPSCGNTGRRTP